MMTIVSFFTNEWTFLYQTDAFENELYELRAFSGLTNEVYSNAKNDKAYLLACIAITIYYTR